MGTRGCIGWTFDGKNYIETYNHYDSYPEGLGKAMVEAIEVLDMAVLKENLKNIVSITDSDVIVSDEQIIKKYSKYSENPNKMEKVDWYWLLRSMQGTEQLYEIEKGNLNHVIVAENWMRDSLFCEYGYTLNFKTNMLELWEGFQEKPSKNNPFGCSKEDNRDYYPCKRVGKISFKTIKDKDSEKVSKAFCTAYKMESF
jgi:hypothetical protein